MRKLSDPEAKRNFMLTTPISRLVPQMALPSIAAMLVNSIYHLADTFFVSKLGTYATGAVGINSAIDHIIMMAGSFLAMGAASFASRLLGAKKDEQAARVISTSFFLALCTGFLVLFLETLFKFPSCGCWAPATQSCRIPASTLAMSCWLPPLWPPASF